MTVDERVRHAVYEHFVSTGRAPTAEDVSSALRISIADVNAAFDRLAAGRVIVLRTGTRDIEMAHPFSATPTGYETVVDGQVYWPNCGWDAMGVAAAIGKPALVRFRCADCDTPTEFSIADGPVDADELRVHFAVPARHWWDDIAFT